MPELVHARALVGKERQRRGGFLDDCRAEYYITIAQFVAIIDGEIDHGPVHKTKCFAARPPRRRASRAAGNRSQFRARRAADTTHAHMHDLHRIGHRVAVTLLVHGVEAPAQAFEIVALLQRCIERVLLTEITQRSRVFERPVVRRETSARKIIAGLSRQSLGDSAQPVETNMFEQADAGFGIFLYQVGHEHAPGGKPGRRLRYDHFAHVHFARDQRHEHRAGAAIGQHAEFARVKALLNGDLADGTDRTREQDIIDSAPSFDVGKSKRLSNMLEQAVTGSVGIEAYLTAEEIVRVDVTEHNGGVGKRRLRSAAAVAYWPW